MKLFGIGGLGTGKLGNQVFAVRSGEQIVRQYNPIVSNPSTPAQVETRAKLKLASQLAAVVAPAIAIPADGLKTKRNEFISRNYPSLGYADDKASINMGAVQLTKGTAFLPEITAERSGDSVQVALAEGVYGVYDYVVWAVVEKNADGSLVLKKQQQMAITQSDDDGTEVFGGLTKQTFIYCYGIRANNEESRAKYAEMLSSGTTNVVSLATSRDATLSNVTISRTSYAEVAAPANNG